MVLIRVAEARDFPRIQEIEVAAGELFREVGMPEIAEHPPPEEEFLKAVVDRTWCAEMDGTVVGYLVAMPLDGSAHITQVSVDPRWRGLRVGARLINHLEGWAREQGLGALTLTTFRHVPWNGPYYKRLGFRPTAAVGGLADVVARERAMGLDPALRLCMRRPVGEWAWGGPKPG